MNTQEDITRLLNDLLEKSCDAKRGYQRAAEQVSAPSLKGLFMSLSSQRENFKKSIREEIHALGGEPIQQFRTSGSVQEAFSSPDLLHTLDTIEQTLKGCLNLEMKHLTLCEKTLNGSDFEVSTRNLLIGQQENVKLSLSDIEQAQQNETLSV